MKNLNLDEMLADELEEQIILNVKAGFLSDDEITEESMEYISEEYPEEESKVSEGKMREIIREYRGQYANTGRQEHYLKLDSAFQKLNEQEIVALHCAGYTQSDGFDDCNETASDMQEDGEKVIGCCFYTLQDLEHLLNGDNANLLLSFGNYFEEPTAVEIGNMIVKALEGAGFATEWNQSADQKIAVKDLKWDKVFDMQYPETGAGDFIIEQGTLVKYTGSDEMVVIPDSIVEIGPWAFKDCVSIVNITIPDSVRTIKYTVFSGCTSLSAIVLPEGITEIESWTFYGCSSLVSADLPKGLRKIGIGAFMGCKSLVGITIPESVETICNSAFNSCTSLTGITVPERVQSVDGGVFNSCTALTNLILPSTKYQISDTLVLSADGRTVLFCIPGLAAGEIAIPEGVTAIADSAFINCRNLTVVHIPESVKTVGAAAFFGCTGLTSLILPAKVRKIDEAAFQMCTDLTSMTIPDGVRKIHKRTFGGCTSLKNVTIPECVQKIDKLAFEDCDLTELTICAAAGSCAEAFAEENKIAFSEML